MSGQKRPYTDDPSLVRSERSHDDSRREKPRDWRSAFLDDEEPGPSRHRGADQGRRGDRDGSADRYRERRRDDRGDRERERDGDRARGQRREVWGRRYDRGSRSRDRDGAREGHSRDRVLDRGTEGDGSGRRYSREGHGDRRRDSREREHTRAEFPHRTSNDTVLREPARASSRPDPSQAAGRGMAGGVSVREAADKEEGEIESPPKANAALPSQKGLQQAGVRRTTIPTGPRNAGSNMQARSQPEEPVFVLEEETDPVKLLEERRKKREEIMARFRDKGNQPPADAQPKVHDHPGEGVQSVTSGGARTGERTGATTTAGAQSLLRKLGTQSAASASTPIGLHDPSLAATPNGNDFDLTKAAETAGADVVPDETKAANMGADALVSAADYDPTQAAIADRERRLQDRGGIEHAQQVADGLGEPVAAVIKQQAADEWEEVQMEVTDDEEDDYDMFAAFGDEDKPKKKKTVTVRRRKAGTDGPAEEIIIQPTEKKKVAEIVDNVDDTEGYYRITPGEVLDDGRYQVTISLGKGMFSSVVKAKVLKAVDQERRQDVVGKEVAIKIVRSQESMYVAGRKEAGILKKLNDADPEDKKHIVRLDRTFEHRGHLCIVTESLSMNLRDVIKRFGKDVGLNMRAVRAYAHQMFLALSLMRKCSIVHADIKPDNVLVSESKAVLKVCDLGSASDVSEGEITPYLVSRFYRAPEIILGLPYDTAIDIWSIGCTLYELYTGKILFPGRSNNHMLLLMMEVKGKLNHRMIKKSTFGEMHFDENNNFISIEKDKITSQDVVKTLVISKAKRDLRSRLMPPSSVQVKMKEEELKMLSSFIDLLDKCLQLDPVRRISPREALLHPFISGQ